MWRDTSFVDGHISGNSGEHCQQIFLWRALVHLSTKGLDKPGPGCGSECEEAVIGGLEDEEVRIVWDAVGVAAGVTVGRCVTRP